MASLNSHELAKMKEHFEILHNFDIGITKRKWIYARFGVYRAIQRKSICTDEKASANAGTYIK